MGKYKKMLDISWNAGYTKQAVAIEIHHDCSYGVLAQLGEHLPYKQRVIGSSPIGPI